MARKGKSTEEIIAALLEAEVFCVLQCQRSKRTLAESPDKYAPADERKRSHADGGVQPS